MIKHTTTHRNYRIEIESSLEFYGTWAEIKIFNPEGKLVWNDTGIFDAQRNAEDQACEAIDVFLDE